MMIFLFRGLACICLIVVISVSTALHAQTPAVDEPLALSLNKDLLVARWSAGNEDITLTKSGASFITINTKTCPGTWTLNGNILTISPAKQMWKKGDPCSTVRAWQVISVSTGNLELIDAEKNPLHLTHQK